MKTATIQYRRSIYLIITALLLSSCSSVPDTVYEEFTPEITKQGLQLFNYKAVLDVPSKERNSKFARQHPRKAKDRSKIERQALAALDAKLEQSNYCPNGYFIIDKFINRTKIEIRGECKSIASSKETVQ